MEIQFMIFFFLLHPSWVWALLLYIVKPQLAFDILFFAWLWDTVQEKVRLLKVTRGPRNI